MADIIYSNAHETALLFDAHSTIADWLETAYPVLGGPLAIKPRVKKDAKAG